MDGYSFFRSFTCWVWLLTASQACGDVIINGTGGTIPDANPTGFSSTVNVAQNELITGNLRVDIFGLSHTYVGDLIATLTGPNGTTVTLFNRIGRVSTGFGDSSNFNGNYSFLDTPTNPNGVNIWTEASSGNTNYTLRSGQFRATGSGSSTPVLISPSFAGFNTQGNWVLRLTDVAGSDSGAYTSWRLSMSSVVAVPEPAGVVVIVTIGLGIASTCRQRREIEPD